MRSINALVTELETWSTPKKAFHRGRECGFLLSCSIAPVPADFHEISRVALSADLIEFWEIAESADLFVDKEFGQWGLKLFSPAEVIAATLIERNDLDGELGEDDYVIGEFYGDSDQLVISCAEAEKGVFPVLIKLPIDCRREWPRVADSFSQFLEEYLASQGDKYWDNL